MAELQHVAIVGATGVVGQAILSILTERNFPVEKLSLLASERSAGGKIDFKGEPVVIESLADFDFSGVDVAFFSAGSEASKKYAPIAAAAGVFVVDNTSCFRYDDSVPLVVPEVNPHALANVPTGAIVANPNCSTAGIVVALKPLYDAFGVKRVNITTLQSVSGGGKAAIDELLAQTTKVLAGEPIDPPAAFSQQMAFNVLPQIDEFQDNGYTREEMKVVWETQKMLEDPDIEVNVTAVRVPVLVGHSASVSIELRDDYTLDQAIEILAKAPGLVIMNDDKPNGYPTPINPVAGADPVYVGRIRRDISHPNALNCWVVSDNLRKGAALNSVQIAELWLSDNK